MKLGSEIRVVSGDVGSGVVVEGGAFTPNETASEKTTSPSDTL